MSVVTTTTNYYYHHHQHHYTMRGVTDHMKVMRYSGYACESLNMTKISGFWSLLTTESYLLT